MALEAACEPRASGFTLLRAQTWHDYKTCQSAIRVPSLQERDEFHRCGFSLCCSHRELGHIFCCDYLRESHWLISSMAEKCACFVAILWFLLQVRMVFTMATFYGPWVPSVPWWRCTDGIVTQFHGQKMDYAIYREGDGNHHNHRSILVGISMN